SCWLIRNSVETSKLIAAPILRTKRVVSTNIRARETEPSPRLRENDVGRLLANHVHRAHDEETRNAREHRGIDDAQIARAVHAKVAGQNAAGISCSDCARAARVMPPGVRTDELLEVLVAHDGLARHLLTGDVSALLQRCGHSPHEADALD